MSSLKRYKTDSPNKEDYFTIEDYQPTFYESLCNGVGYIKGFFGSYLPCICCCYQPYQSVLEGHQGLILNFGRYTRDVNPGLHYINPVSQELVIIDRRTSFIENKDQVILTKDNISAIIDSVIYYNISDSYKSVFKVDNVRNALKELSITTLRDILSKMTLEDTLSHRDILAAQIKDLLRPIGEEWGANITSVLIKDIRIPEKILTVLSAKIQAEKNAEAKIVSAEADVQAAKLFREAADTLSTPAALQIRHLETIKAVANTAGTKVLFVPFNEPNAAVSRFVETTALDQLT
eukprot:TRINITY_DN16107_c0_g1_i1.p1 TRINITY_DN16107_c0_g1~~TRINITY_DN16107_c0_g1_i1.p1  ORF type:complete len:292 (-),score=14.36 TRINITY_DN16107_c0_g1_i1:161-1036(-)